MKDKEYSWDMVEVVDNTDKEIMRNSIGMTKEGWLDIKREAGTLNKANNDLKCVYTEVEMQQIANEMQPFGEDYISLFNFTDCVIHDLRYGLVTLTF